MTSRDGKAYERFSAAVNPLMMVLALATIPLLVVPLIGRGVRRSVFGLGGDPKSPNPIPRDRLRD